MTAPRRIGWILCTALLTLACARRPLPAQESASAAPPQDFVPHQRDADDLGRFLAGLPGHEGSPFTALESEGAWKEHRRSLDLAWERAEGGLIAGLRDFQRQELAAVDRNSTVFYPFGGPDALAATLCFPNAPAYVLVGLEPAGRLPSPRQIEKKNLPLYLAEVRETMASELGRSFFITRQMDHQLRGQVTDGVLLPLLHLLIRTQHTILGLRYVRLDEQGKVVDRDPNQPVTAPFANKGVEIEFRADAEQAAHKLYYFTVNLSDKRLSGNQGFLTYVAGLKNTATLLKATSYMTHRSDFSTVRGLVLDHSAMVLQDDSGIPYHYFRPDVWKLQLYGQYNRPYGSFRWLEQPDLRKAYLESGPKPLAARVGYGYSKIPSNLLLARRAEPVTTARLSAVTPR